jgi:hypothetical protein
MAHQDPRLSWCAVCVSGELSAARRRDFTGLSRWQTLGKPCEKALATGFWLFLIGCERCVNLLQGALATSPHFVSDVVVVPKIFCAARDIFHIMEQKISLVMKVANPYYLGFGSRAPVSLQKSLPSIMRLLRLSD